MAKLRKLKEIENYKPIHTVYENQKSNREKALETANNCDPKLKEPTKYDLKR
jgi:hypothetical protein